MDNIQEAGQKVADLIQNLEKRKDVVQSNVINNAKKLLEDFEIAKTKFKEDLMKILVEVRSNKKSIIEFKEASAKFSNGASIPMIGLGTWLSDKGKAGAAVKYALENGYRHIDCAHLYLNEDEIGEHLSEVFKAGTVRREDVFICSKLWCNDFAKENVIDACKLTLKNLQLDYVDLYLVHVPPRLDKSVATIPGPDKKGLIGYTPELMKETWQEMEKLVEMGLVKAIGVSNFTTKKIKDLLEFAKIKPVCNQVEMHPFLPQTKLVEWCKENGIVCSAYSPLGAPARPAGFQDADHPVLLQNDVILSIAKKHSCSPAQVVLAWAMQRGTPVLPKSVTFSRIDENLKSAELKLDADDVTSINGIKQRTRYVDQRWGIPDGVTMDEYWDGEFLL
eukprot:gene4785-5412_t